MQKNKLNSAAVIRSRKTPNEASNITNNKFSRAISLKQESSYSSLHRSSYLDLYPIEVGSSSRKLDYEPSLISEKNEKKNRQEIIMKLETSVRGLHSYLLEQMQRRYSPFQDILFLGFYPMPQSKQSSRISLNKKFLSSRLDSCIASKIFDRGSSAESNKQAYEEEKHKHKALEGKSNFLVDLLAYDDVGMRLFYEHGSVNLAEIHSKYLQVNIAFSENDLLSLTRMIIRAVSDFAIHSWFFNGFDDLSNFVFSKNPSNGYQEYTIKIANLDRASSEPSHYVFDSHSLNFPNIPISSALSSSQYSQHGNGGTAALYEKHSSSTLASPSKAESSGSSTMSVRRIGRQKSFNRSQATTSTTIDRSIDAVSSTMSSNRERKSISQPFTIWDKLFGQEIQQICCLIYSIFTSQNGASAVHHNSNAKMSNPFEGYSRLHFYLSSLFREAMNPIVLGTIINRLLNDKSIPMTIIIESTLIEQIRITACSQPITAYSQTGKSSPNAYIADEIRSISMIAVQTINKRYSEEQASLREHEKNMPLPKSIDYYDHVLNINQVRKMNPSTLPVLAEIIEDVIRYYSESAHPFIHAELLLSKAFILFKLRYEGVNPMSLVKQCNSIVTRIQGDESNEICGAAYLLMSEIAARQTSQRTFAIEYALHSYEIRKAVHGEQSRTHEIVESLLQIARMHVVKANYVDSIKYFEKAASIAEELKGPTHRLAVEIQSEFALALFLIENYSACFTKCESILETYQKVSNHLLSFSFPFVMNLSCLSLLLDSAASLGKSTIDSNSISRIISLSMNAAKITAELRGPEPQNNSSQQMSNNSQALPIVSDNNNRSNQNKLIQPSQFFNQLKQLQTYFTKDSDESSSISLTQQSPRESRFKNGISAAKPASVLSTQQYSRQSTQTRSLSSKHSNIGSRYLKSSELLHQNSVDSASSFYA